jgi:signal transduction histidine kinase
MARCDIEVQFICDRLSTSLDGCGFDVNATGSGGIGLANMRRRLEPFNGLLSINSAPLCGTCIEVCVPILNTNEAAA